jgi:alpha-L-fucosidase
MGGWKTRIVLSAILLVVGAALGGESPEARQSRMKWWREARFGMFIHWGVYSVPAGTYKGKRIRGIGEWIMNRARIPVKEYEKFAAQFDPVKFDADEWARIAAGAGMKYMVITSKHHDGFCLWDSKVSDYDIVDAAPFKRDILKELADACAKHKVRFCFYHSIMDWHHPDAKGERFPTYRDEYLKPQLRELLTGYGPIGVLWFDGEWIREWTEPQGRDLYDFCRGLQPGIIVNNRVGKGRKGMQGMSKGKEYAGDFGTPEQQIPAKGLPGVDWETCMTMNDTWGYKSYDHRWKPAPDLIRKLVDIASKGGNFLLNVGPTAEGLIPAPSVERLAAIGRWMTVNGESIYATTASPFGRLPWGRCTAKPGRLYLHVFNWPKDGMLAVPGIENEITGARLLAGGAELRVRGAEGKTLIELPSRAPDEVDSVVALDVVGEVEVAAFMVRADKSGAYTCEAADAALHGGLQYEADKKCVGYWTEADYWASWDLKVARPGRFNVAATYANTEAGSEFVLGVGERKISGRVRSTGSWTDFVTDTLGELKLDTAGKVTLSIKATKKVGPGVMNLRAVTLRPVEP